MLKGLLKLHLIHCALAILLRVRLPTGVVRRIEIDEDSSIQDLEVKLVSQSIAKQNSTYILGDVERIIGSNIDSKGNRMKSLGLSSGDLITVLPSETDNESTKPKTNSTTVHAKKKANGRGKIISLADINEQRSNMIAITSEKFKKDVSIGVSLSTMQLLERYSRLGGVGLLLGRIASNAIIKSKRRGKEYKHRRTIITSSTPDDDDDDVNISKSKVDVLAVCELVSPCNLNEAPPSTSTSSSLSLNSDGINNIDNALKTANALGLSVVGCCISLPLADRANVWSSYHVATALQIREICKCDSSFIILR